MAFAEWDCDCGWELDFDSAPGLPPPPPPLFDLPPPPVPPSLAQLQAPELCASASAHPLGLETCQAFLISDAEYREPAKVADWMPVVFASAATLTIVFIAVLVWRYKKQREQQQKSLLRCHQKTVPNGVMDPATLLQGLGDHQVTRVDECDVDDDDDDDVDGVFYDELISYPTHFRAVKPPAYEMKDVLFKSPNSSPCHCTTHPLLGNVVGPRVHYVSSTSPYHAAGSGGSHSPPTSSTPTADCSWTAEPVYEELPSGPDDDARFSRDSHRQRNGSAGVHGSLQTPRGGSVVRKPSKASTNSSGQWSDEPCETDFFLPPSTWYRQPHANLIRGQLTAHGPVRQGRGGIRAAWRELDQHQPQQQQQQQANGHSLQLGANNHAGRKKRKSKAAKNDAHSVPLDEQPLRHHAESPALHYHSAGLYRGKCPPEEPPFIANGDDPLQASPAPVAEENGTPSKTLPRYYYYSESDDYGVGNQKRTLSSLRRNNQQRHLARNQRTQQQQAADSFA